MIMRRRQLSAVLAVLALAAWSSNDPGAPAEAIDPVAAAPSASPAASPTATPSDTTSRIGPEALGAVPAGAWSGWW